MKIFNVKIKTIKSQSKTYEILQPIGEGKNGNIFKAHCKTEDGQILQTVALKFIKSKNFAQQLRSNLFKMMQVKSKNCVTIFGIEVFNQGQEAIVMELVDGVTLRKFLLFKTLDEDLIHEILSQIQSALIDLNRYGLCHGDLSFDNILINSNGLICLVDFGWALGIEKFDYGTWSFLAPERWQGSPPSLQSDFFSLGLLKKYLEEGMPAYQDYKEWRLFIDAIAKINNGWLSADPFKRNFDFTYQSKSKVEKQIRLGKFVREILLQKQQCKTTTLIKFEAKNALQAKITPRPIFMILSLLLSLNLPTSYPYQFYSWIEVRTWQWFEFFLDGKSIGYPPFNLKVSSGKHELSWVNRLSKGKKFLNLKSGERALLNDKDFR